MQRFFLVKGNRHARWRNCLRCICVYFPL